jgi:NMD protein affecting ribosome stability and mRNA decay
MRACPGRTKTSERLISFDEHTGKGKIKWTFSSEISPVCKVFTLD